MGFSTTHLLMLFVVVVLLFGRNKISDLMGDVAKGIKSFKKGMAEDDGEDTKGVSHGPALSNEHVRETSKTA